MKTIKQIILLVGLLAALCPATAQTWTQTSAPITNWVSVACSANGNEFVAAVGGGGIYTSTNSGMTWNKANLSDANWQSVASTANGGQLIAVSTHDDNSNPGIICISTNSGKNWSQFDLGAHDLMSVACSADGTKLVVADNIYGDGEPIYVSTDSGANWIETSPYRTWKCAASSADGSKLFAGITEGDPDYGAIFVSSDFGETWDYTGAPLIDWTSIACSAGGTKLVAASTSFECIYTSTNSGDTWTSNDVPVLAWQSVASSSDGNTIVAASSDGRIYSSTNSGTTWVSNSVPSANWSAVACSSDGNKFVAIVNGGGIYIRQITPSPQLNLASSSTNFMVSWTVPSTNFVLQQSSNLTAWADVPNVPVLNLTNLQYQVTLPATNPGSFYRLKTP